MSSVQTRGQNNEEFAMVRILLLNKKKNGSEPFSMLRFVAKTMRINGYLFKHAFFFTRHLINFSL